MTKKQKLELTWVGKENRPRLEPRILREIPEKSYHAAARVSDNDIFDNVLIHGDNLLALKALEADYAGKVKCVFIDPPYNTHNAFKHYDDGLEHSIWLGLMRDRLEIIRRLLSDDGSLWITIDDNEAHYLKVLCDEIFGRTNFVSNVIWQSSDNSNNDAKQFSTDHNHILVYSNKPDWLTNKTRGDDAEYGHFKNTDNDPRGPWFDGNPLGSPAYRENLIFDLVSPQGHTIKPPANGWRWSKETLAEKMKTGEIRFTPNGKGIRRRTYLWEQKGLPPSTLWTNLEETGHNRQAKFEQKKLFPDWVKEEWFGTPKPEKLLKRIFDIATKSGDLVLDSFAGSGTTGAVAQKMGRRWIMVELGDHCTTHIVPRLAAETSSEVIDQTISIPRISLMPKGEVKAGFRPFKLDLSTMNLVAPDGALLARYLDRNEADTIGVIQGNFLEKTPEDYVVSGLINFPDVSYDDNADLLYDLAGQVVEHLRSRMEHNELMALLQAEQDAIARAVRAQMLNHYWIDDTVEYEAVVKQGFTEIRSSAHTSEKTEPLNYRSPPADKSNMARYLFGGYSKCLVTPVRFQSDTERKLSVILERESLKWFKPAKGQFQMFYRDGSDHQEYIPDFVAETESEILMLEPKMATKMQDSDVLAKRDVAVKWCQQASEHGISHGGKPWRYVLIPHDQIQDNMGLDFIVKRFGEK